MFSLPTGTEMFHFPAFPPHTLYIQVQVTGHDSSQVSPFGHPRITARLPTPQGLSQATTSFIGSRCQGIHHVPFIACHTTNTPHHQHRQPHRPSTGSRAHSRHEHTPPQSQGCCTNNCYKDARVHYKKTKHQAQQPTTPTTRRDQQKAGTETHTTPHPGKPGPRHVRMRPQNPNSVPPHPPAPHRAPPEGSDSHRSTSELPPNQPSRHHERAPRPNQPGPPHPHHQPAARAQPHPHTQHARTQTCRWFCMCSLERR